ncbi:uncharacterized protein N7477_000595 [Penicillium maclennaniae]|uniref:uncharacterized protein n=1 Tax=Penicillium maclennaniae TaxID=1343394 RepID=UPI00253FE846|nr:uncharacterized protein N7477_000595 [Penicillium maclennaniae]KAJ5684250.1 hypothetical protein N7477_000595 [Penicillium maclennaniae]
MVRRVVHHEDLGRRRHEGPTPKARKLTLSCSRCPASKLKCDRNEPCNECTKRAVGHMCTKDERQPRAKRTKTDPSNNTQATEATEAEHTAELLESFVEGALQTQAHDLSSSTGCVSQSMVAPDYPNPKWTHTGYSQRLKLMRDVIDKLPAENVIRALHETFLTRCQAPLGNIIHTPAFEQQAQSLCDCLIQASPEARCSSGEQVYDR